MKLQKIINENINKPFKVILDWNYIDQHMFNEFSELPEEKWIEIFPFEAHDNMALFTATGENDREIKFTMKANNDNTVVTIIGNNDRADCFCCNDVSNFVLKQFGII